MKIDIRNNSNFFWRVVFTLIIALLHSNYIDKSVGNIGWYLAVDYFFIISGFMLVNSFLSKRESTSKYILSRILKLWPHQIFSFGVLILWFIYSGSLNSGIKSTILKHFGEIMPFGYFMFDVEFAGDYPYNFPAWYLSVLLFCSLILYYFLDKHEQALKNVIAPCSVVLIYGYMYRSCSSFNTGNNIGLFLNEYYIRGFAGMCIGVIIFYAVQGVQKYSFKKCIIYLFRISEFLCLCGMIIITYIYGGKNDLWWVALMSLGIFFSFLYPVKTIFNTRFMKWLNALMYPVFLNHIFVINVLNYFGISGEKSKNVAIYIVSLLVYSLITKVVVEKCVMVVRKYVGYCIQKED